MIVTLEEKRTLTNPFYLFIFTHATTQEQAVKSYNSVTDELSEYVYRYNKYAINPAMVFAGLPAGWYQYEVREQTVTFPGSSTTTIDLSTDGDKVLAITGATFAPGDVVRVQANATNYWDGVVVDAIAGNYTIAFADPVGTGTFSSWQIGLLSSRTAGNVVETGKLYLTPSSELEYTQYNTATTYAQYEG